MALYFFCDILGSHGRHSGNMERGGGGGIKNVESRAIQCYFLLNTSVDYKTFYLYL